VLRVQRIAHGIAEQVEAEHVERQREAQVEQSA
jgi:hypothetical protein